MLINTFLDTEDFVHLYYPEDEPSAQAQGCGAGARMASKYPPRPPSPVYSQVLEPATSSSSEMSERERYRAPPPPEPPPHRVRASDLYPRLRTHYDEPGLDPGFTPICGEFIQWVGRTSDGGTIAMSNYRLHSQPRRRKGPGVSVPLRLIDAVEIRDLLHLVVLCKHGRQLVSSFTNGDQCIEWCRRINTALAPIVSVQETFAAAYAAWAKEQPPTSIHRALLKASHSQHRHWFGPELERLGFTTKGMWRVSAANAEYKLCPSYPPLLVVPASIGDEELDSVARFRTMRRIPAVVWRHKGNGAVIARSSQPEVGWFGWRSSEDERLLAAFVSACASDRGNAPQTNHKQLKLLIVDARSYASAVTNRARGGGCECQQYYPAADIQFMCLPNIHHVRRSFQQMRTLAAEIGEQSTWLNDLERTLWLQNLSGVVRAANDVSRAVQLGRPVLVHCSDGWDRTPQIIAAAQLLLDPYYRTLEGFRVLIEREWLDFGHKFADRCGHQFGPEDANERSPIFLQWLDVVHQLMRQFPCSFEFNEAYLIKLATHVHSCMFGTFLCNTSRERIEQRVQETTAHVWQLLRAPAYRNHLYSPREQPNQVLRPECNVRSMQVWWSLFGGERETQRSSIDDLRNEEQRPHSPLPHNGLSKTRSCDNLLNECEKRMTQRRSSDPSITPDVMKLSSFVTSPETRPECKTTLTDSCIDTLPVLQPASENHHDEQFDGINQELFESRLPRDITSNSSSLERELVTPNDTINKIINNYEPEYCNNADLMANDMTGSVVENLPRKIDTNDDDDKSTTDVEDNTSNTLDVERSEPIAMPNARSSIEIGDMNESVMKIGSVDVMTPGETPVFVCDTFTDAMAEAARDTARTRHISITWRSVSESSNQSSTGFDLPDAPNNRVETSVSRDSSPTPTGNTSETDDMNLSSHSMALTNGQVNGVNGLSNKYKEVDLNGGATSSSTESEGESHPASRRTAGSRRVASQLTLCPASPRRCHCDRRVSQTSGIETSCESGASSETCWCGVCGGEMPHQGGGKCGRAVCLCGVASGGLPDPLDGLPPVTDPLQARLHEIILYQKKVVEELSGQLREAREALKRASPSPSPAGPAPPPRFQPSAPSPTQMTSSGSGSVAGSGSDISSASEVEASDAYAHWLPDSATSRCLHCNNHFWFARRKHHCRRCGGIFCGSCSQMSSWGDCGSVRMCRRCRELR